MRKIIFYILFACMIYFISTELMLSSLATGYERVGNRVLWIPLPATLFFAAAVIFTYRVTVPRLLLKGRFGLFAVASLLIAYLTLMAYLLIENTGNSIVGIAPRAEGWNQPWVYIERFCDSITMTMILFGIGAWRLFQEWNKETKREVRLTKTLRGYLDTVKNRLNPERIYLGLAEIEDTLKRSDDEEDTSDAVDNLSDYLRRQLYDLPDPPTVEVRPRLSSSDKIADFFSEKKYRIWRHLIFQMILLLISCEIFFDNPDTLRITPMVLPLFIGIYIFFNVVVWLNRVWLFKKYSRHLSPSKYLLQAVMIVLIPFISFIVIIVVSTGKNFMEALQPFWIFFLSALGMISTAVLFEAGLASLFIFKHWIIKRKEADTLAAETVRQEYLFLKKQINPHFLFNVLNNINLLGYEDREEALRMLGELRRLIEYQYAEASALSTTPQRELSFLDSYLRLEASRTDNLHFSITSDSFPEDCTIPTLLFIPVVENAVKHSLGVKGERRVEVNMTRRNKEMVFSCVNNYNAQSENEDRRGGIGLSNLYRRLRLLYGDSRKIEVSGSDERFAVNLHIPL